MLFDFLMGGWISEAHPPTGLAVDALRLSTLQLFTLFMRRY
jgi:hypothetical protein